MLVRLRAVATVIAAVVCTGSCGGRSENENAADSSRRVVANTPSTPAVERPDESPVMVNKELPFRYPAALYARKVQGNVTLRLFIDRDGRARPESTRVEESSGFIALDSAAVRGSQDLQFIPAKLRGDAMGIAILFPVYFRHPEAPPLPGDSILARRQ